MLKVWIFIREHAWVPFFLSANLAGVFMIPLGLPGLWLQFLAVLAVTVGTAWLGSPHLGWIWTAAVLSIAIVAEIVDFVIGKLGFESTKGSGLAAWLSLAGGFFFGFLGMLVPIPIPVLGSLIGSLVMSFVGTFVGAILGEVWHQKRLAAKLQSTEKAKTLKPALRVATGAVLGRACGIAAKLWFAFVAFCLATVGVLWDIVR